MATTLIPYDQYTQGFQQGQYHQGLLAGYPGGNIIQQQMTGMLPADVLSNIYQQGAERGVSTGMPGSGNANAATMRALGLTSLDLQQQGLDNALKLYGTAPQQKISPGVTVDAGPKDTAYPLGPGASASSRGGAGGAVAAEPKAPGDGYDSFLTDWMNRYGVSSVRGAPTDTVTGQAAVVASRSGATTGANAIPSLATPDYSGLYDNSGGGIDLSQPDWLQQYLSQYGGIEEVAPYETGTFAEYPEYDPFGFTPDFYPMEGI